MAFQNTSFWATGYHWDFGDDATSTEKNPVHEYAQPGVYTVTLIARNWCSAETYSQEVAVGISAAQEPVAADLFQALPNPTTTGLLKLDLKQTSAADVQPVQPGRPPVAG